MDTNNLHPIFEEILQAHDIIPKPAMKFNVCATCEAKDGRAGLLINGDCLNCYDTRKTGTATLHTHLSRLPEEIVKTLNILTKELPTLKPIPTDELDNSISTLERLKKEFHPL